MDQSKKNFEDNQFFCDDNTLLKEEISEPCFYSYYSLKKAILNLLIYTVLLNYRFLIVENLWFNKKEINLNNLEIINDKNVLVFLLFYIDQKYYSIICYKNNFDLSNLNFNNYFQNLNLFLNKIENNSFKLSNLDKNYIYTKVSFLTEDILNDFLSCYPWALFSKSVIYFKDKKNYIHINEQLFFSTIKIFYKKYNLDLEIGEHPLDPQNEDFDCPILCGWENTDKNFLLSIVTDELQIWFDKNNFNKF